ncbi:hypothetical protein ACUM5Y_05160 [Marinomonas dokdonensis]|uniref:hypothetical protein n=1 Tax=Marinomonas dokdonensis TaxID=328224 RepID=UPI003293B165
MKKLLSNLMVLSLAVLTSQVALAHPGHDHSHWTSNPIHIITMVAIGTVIVGGLVYKQTSRIRNRKEK